MTEVWRAIPSAPGYEASSLGRIRGAKRVIQRNGSPATIKEKILSQSIGSHGYLQVNAHGPKRVHILVAEAFLGPRPAGLDVCHNDGSRTNNHVSNLRYGTRSDNLIDAVIHRTHHTTKLAPDQVRLIRRLRGIVTGVDLAALFGVSPSAISLIHRGRKWRHIQ